MKKKKTIGIGRFVFNIPVALILIIIAMMVLVPVVWVTLSAFKTEKEIISWPLHLFRKHLHWKILLMYKEE